MRGLLREFDERYSSDSYGGGRRRQERRLLGRLGDYGARGADPGWGCEKRRP